MALNPFAALEYRVNNAVFARLANASVSIEGAQAVGGIFDAEYATASVGVMGMATSSPVVQMLSPDVPANVEGLSIVVNDAAFVVVASEPDGTGITRLLLEVT